jgi:hypothetical protein
LVVVVCCWLLFFQMWNGRNSFDPIVYSQFGIIG